MDEMIFEQIVKEIAYQQHVEESQVYEAMQTAIDHAFYNEDIQIRDKWHRIPCIGEKPTPQEVIEYFNLGLD